MYRNLKYLAELMLIVVLVLVSFLACSKDEKGEKLVISLKKKQVQFWFPEGLAEMHQLMAKQAESFYKKTGIQVQISHVGWEEMRNKLRLASDAGNPPDVVEVGFDTPVVYASMGKLKVLDEYVSRDKVDMNDYAKVLVEAGTIEGKTYGIPWIVEDRAIFYRKDIFAAAGIPSPDPNWTWEDLGKIARKINNPPQVYGYAVMAGLNDQDTMCWFEPIMKSYGGDYFDVKYVRSLVNNEGGVKALKIYTDLVKDGVSPKDCISYGREDIDNGFVAGKFAMVQSGPWLMKRLHKDAPQLEGKWEVASMPGAMVNGKYKKYAFSAGCLLIMFDKGSVQNEYAWEWIKYQTSPEMQKQWYELELVMQSKSGMKGVEWKNKADSERLQRVFIPLLDYGEAPPKVVSKQSFGPNGPIPTALQKVIIEGWSAKKAADLAAKMYEDQLKNAIYYPGKRK